MSISFHFDWNANQRVRGRSGIGDYSSDVDKTPSFWVALYQCPQSLAHHIYI